MSKRLIFLNILIVSLLVLSSCTASFKVQQPAGGDDSSSGTIVLSAPATESSDTAQGGLSGETLMYVIGGLVAAIVLIALFAVARGNRNSNN